ncbi:cupin domain-containing protein [Staphylococcus rostri]|uniref:Cupin domain-containing protein n=1 Tax=Staphylococcus rostri TaxID=522262 RepID=A0A2K3YSH6_9STAP|nr:cupin domain-containing protein [Staphylococcus rostri]MDO5376369.1 cupin domain-containing protein [Staphylococcus rostri]PNZ28559.1 cupin domain-containing protein [Staphylococcus rostri]
MTRERYFKLDTLHQYCDFEAKKNIFYQSKQSAGAVWCIRPGQFLKAHKHADADDVWIVLEGEGEFTTNNGEKRTIAKGDIIVSYPGDIHGVYNNGTENFVMLGFATPMPLDFIEC